nr:Chain B, SMAC/DIABLO [synthetic construct]
AVPIAQ